MMRWAWPRPLSRAHTATWRTLTRTMRPATSWTRVMRWPRRSMRAMERLLQPMKRPLQAARHTCRRTQRSWRLRRSTCDTSSRCCARSRQPTSHPASNNNMRARDRALLLLPQRRMLMRSIRLMMTTSRCAARNRRPMRHRPNSTLWRTLILHSRLKRTNSFHACFNISALWLHDQPSNSSSTFFERCARACAAMRPRPIPPSPELRMLPLAALHGCNFA